MPGKLSQKLEGHRFWNAAVFEPDPLTGAPASAQNVNDRVFIRRPSACSTRSPGSCGTTTGPAIIAPSSV